MYILNIDTGGTFTDCIGSTPEGRLVRQKVLSNSSLRATITSIISPREIEISTNWEVSSRLFAGYSLNFPDLNGDPIPVKDFDPLSRRMSLDSDLPEKGISPGMLIEITAGEEAPVLCARLITATPLHADFPEIEMRLGSTRGTNALLEYKGARTAMLLTRGFRDLLSIGTQQRPDIFAREVHKAPVLAECILEVEERIDARGKVIQSPDLDDLRNKVLAVKKEGIHTVGVALMHSWINPENEKRVREVLKEEGMQFVSVSHELSGLIKYLLRMQTTEVNAYLSPVIELYVNHIREKIKTRHFWIMTSAGGLVNATRFLPKDSLLSGPAGGVVGAAAIGRGSGSEKIISFDMGGTSTDVSRYDHEPDYSFELKVGAASIHSPALTIETVAAGGGSICKYDGYRLLVGPESAGAEPGPACYGAGGPLTITDVNLLLGRLDPAQINIPVYPDASRKRMEEIADDIEKRSGVRPEEISLLSGFLDIANETMAGAIRKISTSKGFDSSEYTLVAFGGAGGMHACSIAALLKIQKVLVPENAGILSAYGIGQAEVERFAEKQVLMPVTDWEYVKGILPQLEREALSELQEEGVDPSDAVIRNRMLFLRFSGQESSIEVPWNEREQVLQDFQSAYESMYGYWSDEGLIEVESLRVIASVRQRNPADHHGKYNEAPAIPETGKADAFPVYRREKLGHRQRIEGPAVILDPFSTTFLEEGWTCKIDGDGTLVLNQKNLAVRLQKDTKEEHHGKGRKVAAEAELELFSRRFMSIAENMGAMLEHASVSVNIKERLDFSCAIVDSRGFLVANAPHIPVHLGSLGICVRRLLDSFDMMPGDTLVTNHPAYGGSHLPDITLVSPVYTNQGERIAFVVNRAHHAEIGGISPGSMPPDAKSLAEEGVVIKPFYLVRNGVVDWKGMEEILTQGPYPTRSVRENLADLNGALAANRKGAAELLVMAKTHGSKKVTRFMELMKDHARRKTRDAIRNYPMERGVALEYLDDGTALKAKISKNESGFLIDFSGSGAVHPGNLNANPAIVHSVIMYVMRLLLNEDIPLNDGMLDPIQVILPECLLNPPFPDDPFQCPALVGGNVELSQRLTDTLLKALVLQAASQGTMNNVLFGNKHFGYYETICGGCGAGPDFQGADAVHHHMTNTRITDPEIMEYRYPVRLERFEIRPDSGGRGEFRGGNGVIREISFLEKVELSLLTQRRNSGPYGLKGGGDGLPGNQRLIRHSGEIVKMEAVSAITVFPGDRLIIETPGGGAWGQSNKR